MTVETEKTTVESGFSPGEGVAFGPDGITARWVFVTPEMAYDWLANQAANRTIARKHADKFIRDLLADRWLPSPQGMGKTTEDKIIDGQHRLYAIFESGVGAWMLVCEQLPPETQKVIDDNRKRSHADDRKIEGDSHYSANAAITLLVARVEAAWELSLRYNTMRARQFSRAELDAKRREIDNLIDIERAARLGQRAYREVNGIHTSAVGTLYYLVSKHGAGEAAATAFIERVISGEGLYEGDPERAVRDKAKLWHRSAQKRTAYRSAMPENTTQLAHLIMGYNKWAQGKPAFRIDYKVQRGESSPLFPPIYPRLERDL